MVSNGIVYGGIAIKFFSVPIEKRKGPALCSEHMPDPYAKGYCSLSLLKTISLSRVDSRRAFQFAFDPPTDHAAVEPKVSAQRPEWVSKCGGAIFLEAEVSGPGKGIADNY